MTTETELRAPSSWANFQQVFMQSQAAYPVALTFALFLAFFLNLHSIPLFDVDEGAFSEATREMLASGNYITTYLNGNLRFDKPILIYWLQAISASLFGINEFAFRLPSALASVAWISAILVFTRQQSDRATGFIAALIGATTLGICVIGRGAIADALLNLFLVLTLFDIYRYMENPVRKYRYRAYLWMGLGLLTKGPIALLIPFVVSGCTFFLQGKWRLWLKAMLDPVGWLILLAVAGPWYLLEYRQQGQAFIDGFIMRHNVDRFQNSLQGHTGSYLFYLPVALVLLLPYTGLFLRIFPTLRALRRDALTTFLWSWFLFVLVFFSFANTKLPHYLLYGVSPLFILMALHRNDLQSRWFAFVPPLLLMSIALALPSIVKLASMRIGNPYFSEMLSRQEVFDTRYYVIASLLMLATLALAFIVRGALWARLVAIGFISAAAVGGLLLPAFAELQQGPVKEAAAVARKLGGPVTAWGINTPSFSVYRSEITKPHQPPGYGELILTRVDRMNALGPVDILYRKGGVALVRRMP